MFFNTINGVAMYHCHLCIVLLRILASENKIMDLLAEGWVGMCNGQTCVSFRSTNQNPIPQVERASHHRGQAVPQTTSPSARISASVIRWPGLCMFASASGSQP